MDAHEVIAEEEEFKCPGCDESCDRAAWDKGKVECCKYCGDCKRYLPAGDWEGVAWDYAEEVGDICPTCSDNWWECEKCQAKWHTDDQDEDYDGENDDNLCPECIKK